MQTIMQNSVNNNEVFLKNYIDYIEEIPNDIQKCITRCREVDYKTKNLTNEVETICAKIMSSSDKKARIKMQQILVKLTELKDEKIHLSQLLASQIEVKYKSVADSFQNNVTIKHERSPTPLAKTSTVTQQNVSVTPIKQSATVNTNNNSTIGVTVINPAAENVEKSVKRIRKTRIDNLDIDSLDDNLLPPPSSQLVNKQTPQVQSTSNTNKRANTNANNKKAKKRKATKKQTNAQIIAQEAIDEVIHDDGIDPDETTYCICQQISYGEMIFCENDTCPIEWFHFSCVDLASKPKGRWFCPQCRGDKPSVINKNLRKKQQESAAI